MLREKEALMKDGINKTAEKLTVNDRILKFTASKEVRDRDNDLVYVGENTKGKGILTDNFAKNPVFLKIHDDHTWPIGKVIDYKKTIDEAGIPEFEISVEFADTDDGNLALYLYKDGFMNAVSIRFRPVDFVFNDTMKGFDIFTSELFEVSAVPLPSNQEALLKKSYDGMKTPEEKQELTEAELKRIEDMIETLKSAGRFTGARTMAEAILSDLNKILE